MHVISRRVLRQFWERYPDSETPLVRWFKIMDQHDFGSLDELRATFPTADMVGDLIVFNVGGNKYRLVLSIHFNRGKVYVRHILTHQEYNKGAWKK
ncbi:MAG: type II toxin-antitoxin system HigB family toxin [Chloroflexota bacterium]